MQSLIVTFASLPDLETWLWTPETFYGAMSIVHVVVILLAFRILRVPADENTVAGAAAIAAATNLVAYLTADFAMIGVMVTVTVLFLFLLAGSRGEFSKSLVTTAIVVATYWPGAYVIEPAESDMHLDDFGAIPQLLIEGPPQ